MKIEYIFAAFALLAILDKLTGNHFGLGDELEKGISTMGALMLTMAGMIVLSPVLSAGLSAICAPALRAIGMDGAVLAGFFPNDAGGALIALELSEDAMMRGYHGMIVASMFGVMLCMLPLTLKLVSPAHREDTLLGLLCGLATMPIGCLVGGLILGIAPLSLLWNTAPIILLSLLICLGLWKAPRLIQRLLSGLGILLTAVIFFGLALGILQSLCGLEPIRGIAPMTDVFPIIGNIALLLAGIFPMLSILSKLLRQPLLRLGQRLALDETSMLGLVTSLANAIPMYTMTKDMNRRGRVINVAFAVSAGYTIGDHLAYSLAFDAEHLTSYTTAMVVSKLISGLCAVFLAALLCRAPQSNKQSA